MELRRLLRSERTMVRVRWGAVVFGIIQIATFYREHPPGFDVFAYSLVALLGLVNIGIWLRVRRGVDTIEKAHRLGLLALTVDTIAATGMVFVYAFDPETAIFVLLYILPLEAALRLQMRGAVTTMTIVTALYVVREIFSASAYGNELLPESISFRMGIGWFIALVAGSMASNLVRDRRELEVAKEELERSAAKLAETNAELAAANEIKDDFLAMTNHELRTPLTTVLGYTSMLRKRWDDIPDERRQEFVLRIEEQGLRLRSMVEGLLTLSSAQAGALQLDMAAVDVRQAVDDAIRHHGLAGASFANEAPEGLIVEADPVRLGQILVNYMTNARKYGAPPIVVTARAEGSWVVIAVEDSGDGVPAQFVPRLFDKFSQASIGDSRTAEGTGLGLAIVRQLARAQGGDAWYEPRAPHGSRFMVRLRAARPPA